MTKAIQQESQEIVTAGSTPFRDEKYFTIERNRNRLNDRQLLLKSSCRSSKRIFLRRTVFQVRKNPAEILELCMRMFTRGSEFINIIFAEESMPAPIFEKE